jgi:phenylacetic acid degradation protein paaN
MEQMAARVPLKAAAPAYGMMGRMTAAVVSHELYTKHADMLQRALTAIAERGYWSAFPESPSPRVYGETAASNGEAAFRAYLGHDFPLDQPGTDGQVATEASPFGVPLDVRYPHSSPDALIAAATAALPAWRDAGPATRTGVCLEILQRLHEHIFELANAVQYTTGQAFVMAFQAGGAHALDRALEALAYAYAEQTRHPAQAQWEKPAGKGDPLRMSKTFHVVPRGVALVIGCNTFPTWNSYPGLFASLATGNPVIVKPHPRAVLPLAITVRYAREVLTEAGFDPNLIQLAAEAPDEKLAAILALRPEVKIIDFTGSTQFGDWLEANARQAYVYTEKAGVNTVIVDSTDDFAGMCRNLAFSLTLYSGQMCTTPQNVLIPRDGIEVVERRLADPAQVPAHDAGHRSFAEVAQGIADAVGKLTGDDARAVELTGAIVNDGVVSRIDAARAHGEVLLDSRTLKHPSLPDAVVRTPLLLTTDRSAPAIEGEWFGPIAFLVATESTVDSVALFRRIVGAKGGLTASVYSTSPEVLDEVERAAMDVGVHLSANLTGGVFVNQSAAFSDFHASGANPAANAALTDGAYVANRFRVVQSRRHV